MSSFDFIKTQYPDFYKKFKISCTLLLLLFAINCLVFTFVSKKILDNKSKNYENSQIIEWQETTNLNEPQDIIPTPAKEAELASKRAEVLNSFRMLGIEPEIISSDTVPITIPNKKILGAKSSISLKGPWAKIIACISLLENSKTITSIESCFLVVNPGQTTAKIDYIIYYEK